VKAIQFQPPVPVLLLRLTDSLVLAEAELAEAEPASLLELVPPLPLP
jgi:hypothetical protein